MLDNADFMLDRFVPEEKQTDELFLGLSSDQRTGLQLLLDWAEMGYRFRSFFTMTGYAGTGKTFLLGRFLAAIREDHPGWRIALVAPTHKAKFHLEKIAQEVGGEFRIDTVHGLLQLRPGDPDENGDRHLEYRPSGRPAAETYELIVCDECSMVGWELFDFFPKTTRVLFVGDIAQLPPVQKDGLIEPSPTLTEPDVLLTEIVRYEGAIAEYATKVREGLEQKYPPKLFGSGNLRKFTDKERWEQELCDAQKVADGLHDVKCLAFTNGRVQQLNKFVRSQIFRNPELPYLEGERLIAKEPYFRDGTTLLPTCGEAEVLASQKREGVYIGLPVEDEEIGLAQVNLWELTLVNELDVEFDVVAIADESLKLVGQYLRDAKKTILGLDSKSARKKLWRAYYEFCQECSVVPKGNGVIHRLQYGYAQTIHQSQGSTFNRVFLDGVNLFACPDHKVRNQLLYVGCTRPSEELNVLMKF